MFHLNFWPTRPFTSPGVASSPASGSTPGTSDFLSLQFPASPALMVLSSDDGDATSAAVARASDGVGEGKRQHHHHQLPHRSPQSPEKSVGGHRIPGGPFGPAGPFQLFRSGVESFLGPGAALFHSTNLLPPSTAFDASFHRAAAAAAALDQRRIHGTLFGYPGSSGYPLHQPSAFQPATKRAAKTEDNSMNYSKIRLHSRGEDSKKLSAIYPPERVRAKDFTHQSRPERALHGSIASASPYSGAGTGEEGRFCSPTTSTDHEMDGTDGSSPTDPTSPPCKGIALCHVIIVIDSS